MKNPKEFLILLASSLVVILAMNFILFRQINFSRIQKVAEVPSSEISTKKNEVALYFSQPTVTDKKLTASLLLNPKEEKIAAVDITISFNPKILKFVQFEPGEVFEKPIVLKKEANQKQGRFRFALATQNPTQQQGILANLTFTMKGDSNEPIEIRIVEEETKIGAIGKTGNVLGKSTNLLYYPEFK